MARCFRRAELVEYVEWLRGYLAAGGAPTHYYDYPWSRAGFLVAEADFTLGGECGSFARSIIVSPGASHLEGRVGHNQLFYIDGFRRRGGFCIVPVYDDEPFGLLVGVPAFVARKIAEAEAEEERCVLRQQHCRSDLSRYLHGGNR